MMDTLLLKKGARVKLTTNINTSDGLVNGSMGTVIGFEMGSHGKLEYVIVSFDDETAGQSQRQKYNWISNKYEDQNGTPIKQHVQKHQPKSKKGFSHAITCKIIQFPLKLAWASTAHSMQGVTVKQGSKVVVHFHKKFKPGMAYVMLSRCERLQDLFITGDFTIGKIKCNPQALEDFIRLSESFQSTLLQRQKELGCLRISFLNVMNIWPHLEDIKQSSLLMSSTVLGLAETWMEPGTTVDFPNFQAIFESIGSGKGLAAFYRE